MRTVVHAAEAAAVHVAVQLRRRQGAVAQQILNRAQVGAAFEQMRGEGVPQPMRMSEHAAQRRRVEPAPTGRKEQRGLRPAHELWPSLMKIAGERVRSLLAERDDALLSAFPSNV